MDSSASALSQRRFWWLAAALITVHLVMVGLLAAQTPWTTDEAFYLRAARAICAHGDYSDLRSVFHGPLPYRASQILIGNDSQTDVLDLRTEGRLGMLLFALVSALAVLAFTARAFGRRAALLGLALHVLNPIVLANAPLVTADVALTGFYSLTLLCTWHYLDLPSRPAAIAVGATLGMALGTKYLALFLVPVLGLALLPTLRQALPWKLLDIGLCGVTAWAVLWLCYGTATPGYDPMASPPLSSWGKLLGSQPLATLAHALPAPFVRGIDFQKLQSEVCGPTAFLSAYAPGHPAYFVVALGIKLPLAWLALTVIGLFVRTPKWPARLPWLVACGILVPLVYLSFFSVLQGGVRYVLATLPLLGLVAARGADALFLGRRSRWLLAALGVGLLWFHANAWPRYTSAFNLLAAEKPYLYVTDSSLDWPGGFLNLEDREVLLGRHPGAQALVGRYGPVLGKVVVWGPDLGAQDPRDPTRVHHWLRRFDPIDRCGAWFVFDVRFLPENLPHDPRARIEMGIALLGTGFGKELSFASVADLDAPLLEEVRRIEREGRSAEPRYSDLLLQLGRTDLLVTQESTPPAQRAQAFVLRHEPWRAITLLTEVTRMRALTLVEALQLANAFHENDQPKEALATLDRHAPPPNDPAAAAWDKIRATLQERLRASRR